MREHPCFGRSHFNLEWIPPYKNTVYRQDPNTLEQPQSKLYEYCDPEPPRRRKHWWNDKYIQQYRHNGYIRTQMRVRPYRMKHYNWNAFGGCFDDCANQYLDDIEDDQIAEEEAQHVIFEQYMPEVDEPLDEEYSNFPSYLWSKISKQLTVQNAAYAGCGIAGFGMPLWLALGWVSTGYTFTVPLLQGIKMIWLPILSIW